MRQTRWYRRLFTDKNFESTFELIGILTDRGYESGKKDGRSLKDDIDGAAGSRKEWVWDSEKQSRSNIK